MWFCSDFRASSCPPLPEIPVPDSCGRNYSWKACCGSSNDTLMHVSDMPPIRNMLIPSLTLYRNGRWPIPCVRDRERLSGTPCDMSSLAPFGRLHPLAMEGTTPRIATHGITYTHLYTGSNRTSVDNKTGQENHTFLVIGIQRNG